MAEKQSDGLFVFAYGKSQKIESFRIPWLAKLVYSTPFELAIAAVIIVNAVCLAVLTIPNLSANTLSITSTIDAVAYVIYVVELVLRIASYGKKPWKFFAEGWNVFDFVVIGLAPFFQGQTAVIRLLRLLRLVRIFRFLPEVRILSASIVKSIPPLMSMTVLITLMLFLYGMAGYYLFGSEAPLSWGDIGTSMKSLFILLTLENFPIYLEEAMLINPLAVPFFLSYVFLIVFTVLNVLIGIVLNAMDEAREEDRSQREQVKELTELSAQAKTLSATDRSRKKELQRIKAQLAKIEAEIKAESQKSTGA